MGIVSLAVFAAALGQGAQPAPPQRQRPIVVTGQRLADTETALRACIARDCPPDEDIAATLAHAENQMLAGKYREARTTLLKSLGRNRGEAKGYPQPVSDLYRASALVANHLGLANDYYNHTWGIYRALKAGIPEPDHRHFGARMEIAAMTARTRDAYRAARLYDGLAEDARKAGRADIAGLAELRGAWILYREQPSESVRARLYRFARSTDPEEAVAASAARLLLARLALQEGKEKEAQTLLRQVAGSGFKTPLLVYAPPYDLPQQEMSRLAAIPADPAEVTSALLASGSTTRRISGNFEDRWIDVGFWVEPNGRVSEVEILRKGKEAGWAAPLLKSIAGRIYTPAGNGAPTYRIERYTYTATYEQRGGTRISQRAPGARIEYLDLTQPPAAKKD